MILLATADAPVERERRLCDAGATVLRTAPAGDGRVDLSAALRALTGTGVREVFCEGGAGLAGGLWRGGLVGEVVAFVAPRVLGGGMPVLGGCGAERMAEATVLTHVAVGTFGGDLCVTGRVPEGKCP